MKIAREIHENTQKTTCQQNFPIFRDLSRISRAEFSASSYPAIKPQTAHASIGKDVEPDMSDGA